MNKLQQRFCEATERAFSVTSNNGVQKEQNRTTTIVNFDDSKHKLAIVREMPESNSAATEINRLHHECYESMRTTLEKAIEVGKLLNAQKNKCGHGEWIPWVETNLEFDRSTATRYMQCYENRSELSANGASTHHLSIEQFAKLKPKKERKPAVKKERKPASPAKEKAKEALRKNPNASFREIQKIAGCGSSAVLHAKRELIAAGELFPESMEAQEAANGLIVEMFIGTCTVIKPLPAWRVIDDANRDNAQVVLCEDCNSYTMGAQPLGSFDEWFYECRCKKSRREAVLERKKRL